MKSGNESAQQYASHFKAFEETLNGESKSSLHQLRREAFSRFSDAGFPTTRLEEWKYTNISPIIQSDFTPALGNRSGEISKERLGEIAIGYRTMLVFVDGHFSPRLSSIDVLPSGVYCGSLAGAVKSSVPGIQEHLGRLVSLDETPFVSLNTAFLKDGACILVPEGTRIAEAIYVLFLASGSELALLSPRNLLVLGKGSAASVVEHYVSLTDGAYLTNSVSEIVVGDGAQLEYDKLQQESLLAYHVSMGYARLERDSRFAANAIAFGGSIVRNNVITKLADQGSECTLNGLSIGTGTQLIDNHTVIDHASPNCASHELYKAILDGKSRGVFNGKIFVREQAQKTDAKQTNKTLLLSDDAVIDTKPQLEIFADDVKCTHGATVGQLDPEQVFYLRSRGIGETEARDVLTFAFAHDVVNRLQEGPLKGQLEGLIHQQLDNSRKK